MNRAKRKAAIRLYTMRRHAIRQLVDLRGQAIGASIENRCSAIWYALDTFEAEGYRSAWRAIKAGYDALEALERCHE